MYYNNGIHPFISQLLNEMNFWMDLSKEHPMFIKTMAKNQKVTIDSTVKERLNKNYKDFHHISKELVIIQHQWNFYPLPSVNDQYLLFRISAIIENILKADVQFLNSLKYLENLSAKDNSWRIFINHITLEQRQLLQICSSYSTKLKTLGY